jgi:hypothetical protein
MRCPPVEAEVARRGILLQRAEIRSVWVNLVLCNSERFRS